MAEKYNQSKLPVKVQQKVDSLNTDWIKLKDLADNLEPVPEDSSILEVLEQGNGCFFVTMARNCLNTIVFFSGGSRRGSGCPLEPFPAPSPPPFLNIL